MIPRTRFWKHFGLSTLETLNKVEENHMTKNKAESMIKHNSSIKMVHSFPNKPYFVRVCSKSIRKHFG